MLEFVPFGHHSEFGLEFKSCSALAFFGSLGVVWSPGSVWPTDSSPPPKLVEHELIQWAGKRTLMMFR